MTHADKPRITWQPFGEFWDCKSAQISAAGRTPAEAYRDWAVLELARQIKAVRNPYHEVVRRSIENGRKSGS